jgi:hypothetical protein
MIALHPIYPRFMTVSLQARLNCLPSFNPWLW